MKENLICSPKKYFSNLFLWFENHNKHLSLAVFQSFSILICNLNDLSNLVYEGIPLALQDKITIDLIQNEENLHTT